MHGAEMSTDWSEGSPITWRGEWKGRAYEDKGTILEVAPQEVLRYTHWSPMSGSEDRPENYHTVTYYLHDHRGQTTTLTVKQDNNATQDESDQMAKNNWAPVLNGLKEIAERAA